MLKQLSSNTSIILIAAIAGIMIAGALVVSLTTSQVFAFNFLQQNQQSNVNTGSNAGVNGDSHTDNGNHNGNANGHDNTPSGNSQSISQKNKLDQS